MPDRKKKRAKPAKGFSATMMMFLLEGETGEALIDAMDKLDHPPTTVEHLAHYAIMEWLFNRGLLPLSGQQMFLAWPPINAKDHGPVLDTVGIRLGMRVALAGVLDDELKRRAA